MKIYANAGSKNSVTYTPDVLIVECEGKTYEYDINGTVEFDHGGLNSKVRGDLEIRDLETDEFRELTPEEKLQLIAMLSDLKQDKTVSMNVYPMIDDEKEETIKAVESDKIGQGYGRVEFNEKITVDFEFKPTFVGF